jgi:hypothetical protein
MRTHIARATGAVALACVLQACADVADAPIPPGYEAVVASARSSVLGNVEGLVRPSLALVRIRCFADGGLVIVFRQVGGPTPGEPAFAMAGSGAIAGFWAGGFGDQDAMDEEIEFNFGHVAEVVCPARRG